MKGFKIHRKVGKVYLSRFDLLEDASHIAIGGLYWFDGSHFVVKAWVSFFGKCKILY